MTYMMAEKIRNIAFVHGDFPFGGAEKVTLDIAEYLAPMGYGVYIFTTGFRKDRMPAGKEYPVKILALPQKDVVKSRADASYICGKIKELDIKVLVLVAKRLKHIDLIRDTGVKTVYAHHNMPFHEAQAYIDRAWIKGRRSPLRHLEWLLISYPKYVLFGQAKKREFRFYRESYDECDRYVMLCDEYKDEIVRRLGLGPSVNKLRVIENYQTLPDRICYDKENIILYTGRLSYADKRLDRLIDAWSLIYGKLPDWKVLIVGDGKEKKNLEKKIRKAGLPRISLEGFSNDPGKYYEKASILALVSTYEGWPLSMTEAQANGVIPVVFGSFAAARHILGENGEYGFIVEPFDIEAYAETLYKVATMPENESMDMRKRITEKVRTVHTMESVGEKWKELFDSLIDNPGK